MNSSVGGWLAIKAISLPAQPSPTNRRKCQPHLTTGKMSQAIHIIFFPTCRKKKKKKSLRPPAEFKLNGCLQAAVDGGTCCLEEAAACSLQPAASAALFLCSMFNLAGVMQRLCACGCVWVRVCALGFLCTVLINRTH